jgi:hypothetical protein
LAVLSTFWVAACTSPSAPSTPVATESAAVVSPTGRTLAPAADLTHAPAANASRAFTADRGKITAALATHAIEVLSTGAFTFQPMHYPGRTARTPGAPAMPVNSGGTALAGAPIHLETTTLQRGATVADAGQMQLRESGAVEIARGFAVEVLEANELGLEQSWKLAERPAGTEDLVIKVSLSGQSFTNDTDSGLHFVDPATGVGVRYGVATFVDRDKHETKIRPRFESGQIVLTVPAEVLEQASFPAVLDPTLESEFGVDAAVGGPSQTSTAVAYSPASNMYLVTWFDNRAPSNGAIRGRMVNSSGGVVGPDSFVIDGSGPSISDQGADPLWDGTNFLVFYDVGNTVMARRVNQLGTVSGAAFTVAAAVAGAPNYNMHAAVNSAGKSLAVFNHFPIGTTEIWGAYVNPGASGGTAQFQIAANGGAGPEWNPSVASNGTDFMVSWADLSPSGQLFARTVNATTNALGTPVAISNDGTNFAHIGFGGGRYIVGWDGPGSSSPSNVRVFLLSNTGAAISSLNGSFVYSGFSGASAPRITYDGTNFGLAIGGFGGLGVAAYVGVSTSGAVVAGPLFASTNAVPEIEGIGSDGNGTMLMTYSIISGPTAKARLILDLKPGAVCSAATDCASGVCTGGFCCASACPGLASTNFACNGAGGSCAVASCNGTFQDCNTLPGDGCESDTTTDANNCGACGTVCPALPNATPGCALSSCGIGSCVTGFNDCTASPGCETAINAIPNCGGCGLDCSEPAGVDCTQDTCVGSPVGACNHYDWGNCAVAGKVGACNLQAGCRHDIDGDGLPDEWETNQGIDLDCNGTVSPAEKIFQNLDPTNPNGANPSLSAKDVYLQYDYMVLPDQGTSCTYTPTAMAGYPGFSADCDFDQYCTVPTGSPPGTIGVCKGHSDAPDPMAVDMVRAKLWEHGINLHVDPVHHQLTSHTRVLSYGPPVAGCAADDALTMAMPRRAEDFYTYKTNLAFFDKAKRQGAFHYMIFAHEYACDSTTNCMSSFCATAGNPDWRASGNSEYIGDDLIVAFGGRYDQTGGQAPPTIINQAATIMHELGHNLGLDHGGPYDGTTDTTLNYKPNFISVMNYAYQLQGISTADRIDRTNCTSDHTDTGTIVPCPVRIDFQDTVPDSLTPTGVLHNLDEHGGMLYETNGVNTGNNDVVYYYHPGRTAAPGQGAIDFDKNNDNGVEAPIPTDTEINNDTNIELLVSHRDWNAIRYDFQCNSLTNGDGAAPPEARAREISWETAAQQGLLYPLLTENIDIRPGCPTNWIAPGYSGNVPVAVFGSGDFDATQVNASTLSFLGTGATSTSLTDLNGDGRQDLIANFSMASMTVPAGSVTATITGQLNSTQALQGTAPITVVATSGPVLVKKQDANGFSGTMVDKLDHTYQAYTLADCVATATDRCNNALVVNNAGNIVKITSDEQDNANGHLHTGPDIQITSNSGFGVRRERNGNGDGRVYTVYYTVSDAMGNSTAGTCKFEVRHDNPGSPAIDSGTQSCVGMCP